MRRWSTSQAQEWVARYARSHGDAVGADLALCSYMSRLIGEDRTLTRHSSGNSSVKSTWSDLLGEEVPALYIKPSGRTLAEMEPERFTALALEPLQRLRMLTSLGTSQLVNVLQTSRLRFQDAPASIESLMHAFIPDRFVLHAHPEVLLVLGNRVDGVQRLQELFTSGSLSHPVWVVPPVAAGFQLATAILETLDLSGAARAAILVRHGLVSWGPTARDAHDMFRHCVERADQALSRTVVASVAFPAGREASGGEEAWQRYRVLAPRLRRLLSQATGNRNRPFDRVILRPAITDDVLACLNQPGSRRWLVTAPMTADQMFTLGALPVWIDQPDTLEQIPLVQGDLPRLLMIPHIGVIAVGHSGPDAEKVREIAMQNIALKQRIMADRTATYQGSGPEALATVEYLAMQRAGAEAATGAQPLRHHVVLMTDVVTGTGGASAGDAIGRGVAQALLQQGSQLIATAADASQLEPFFHDMDRAFPHAVTIMPLNLADCRTVGRVWPRMVEPWGGVDLLVMNCLTPGIHGTPEGLLNALMYTTAEMVRLFTQQGMGGDIVLLARNGRGDEQTFARMVRMAKIASRELAEFDVRVNLVALRHPDVEVDQVAQAVLYFAARRSATSGAILSIERL
jgi:rhamnose utilization protein RhaD (predicted bifunctional aldolase and dehydrogenase)/NAD(P)-dependent dehydrogenase (short-subunit alcohol dehydrogenase family)